MARAYFRYKIECSECGSSGTCFCYESDAALSGQRYRVGGIPDGFVLLEVCDMMHAPAIGCISCVCPAIVTLLN